MRRAPMLSFMFCDIPKDEAMRASLYSFTDRKDHYCVGEEEVERSAALPLSDLNWAWRCGGTATLRVYHLPPTCFAISPPFLSSRTTLFGCEEGRPFPLLS